MGWLLPALLLLQASPPPEEVQAQPAPPGE
jgi:hypothetical protein